MCYDLSTDLGNLEIRSIKQESNNTYHLNGIYNRTPKTLAARIERFFRRLELLEKIAEIVGESLELFRTALQKMPDLHHAAHEIEHVLHPFCFLGDLSHLISGRFLVYDKKKLDYLRSVARVSHAFSHFLATSVFLCEPQLFRLGLLEKAIKYASIFSALGYGMWTISLVWQRYQQKVDKHFASNLGIHLGGCLFQTIPHLKIISVFASYSHLIDKAASLAGIIHAWCFVERLMPSDREEIKGHFDSSLIQN